VVTVLISPFSAIFSWQGYEYQGHVALFVALQKIKELIGSEPIEISNMILEIEGAEDFSIKCSESYQSLHQVKRGAVNLDNDGKFDKFSFIISLLQYDVKKGYYHILPNKTIPSGFVIGTLNHIDELLLELNKKIKFKEEVAEEEFGNFIMVNKIIHNAKKGSLYDILHYVCKGNKEKEAVEEAVAIIRNELTEYREKLMADGELIKDEELVGKYIISFNNSREARDASCMIIKEILDTVKPEWNTFVDENYAQLVYYKIFVELKILIETDFINNPGNDKSSQFACSDMYKLIFKDHKSESNSIDYQYYLILESIKDMYQKYPKRVTNDCIVDLCDECDQGYNCNLHNQLEKLLSIPKEKLHSFLYKIMLKEPDIKKPNNLPDEKLINRLLIKLLKDVNLLVLEENDLVQAQKEGLFYRLTLDSSGEVEELQEQLAEEVNETNIDKLLIYESDILITDQLNQDNFIYDSINTTVIGANEYKELEGITSNSIDKLKKNYCKPKIMRLIDRKVAKEELTK